MFDSVSKYSFKSDYSELAHPSVLQALADVGNKQFDGYGLDEFSFRAADLIREKVAKPSADIHFISGGTQANLVVLSSLLRPHEAVIAPSTGHIAVHEAGAIEATGHKICAVSGSNGKLSVADIDSVVKEHTDEHMVKPRVVYLSQSTESGTVYTKGELSVISEYCRSNKLYLFLDGARLGAAMNSASNDMSYGDIADLTDVFYVGGTKNGALFGEALVICHDDIKSDFRYFLKQRGAMLAKGAAISVQFEALLKDGLYDELAQRAIAVAMKMADGIRNAGYDFLYPTETNMLIPIFPAEVAQKLHQLYEFYDWQQLGDKTAVRLLTSWATPEGVVEQFVSDLGNRF